MSVGMPYRDNKQLVVSYIAVVHDPIKRLEQGERQFWGRPDALRGPIASSTLGVASAATYFQKRRWRGRPGDECV